MLFHESAFGWLLYTALLSLVVLALGSGAMLLCRQPARRLRIIGLTLAGCLLAPFLGMTPGYPQLSIAWLVPQRPTTTAPTTAAQPTDAPFILTGADRAPSTDGRRWPAKNLIAADRAVTDHPTISDEILRQPTFRADARREKVMVSASAAPIAESAESPARGGGIGPWLVGLYLLGVATGVAWWLAGIAALARIIRTARAAPPRCRQLLTEIAGRRSDRVRLLVSRLAKQPFASVDLAFHGPRGLRPCSFQPARTVIVLPENLCDDEQAVRWALAHEWTHIAQGDFRMWFTASLVRVLFFYQPLVWWLRRQLRLCQEYVADARASREASQPEDYAEFLTVRAAAGLLPPAMAGLGMGFNKGKSELYRRIIMLVQNRPLESRPPRLWTLSITCAALVLVAALAALTTSPQAVAEDVTHSDGAASSGDTGKSKTPSSNTANASNTSPAQTNGKPPKAKITLESLGFMFSWSGSEEQRKQRNERISQALTSGRFHLVNLEVIQCQICRDVETGKTFKVQRIPRRDGTEIALPRADFGALPPGVKKTSWKEHLETIREGKRELLKLETVNSYTYEMTADDGTKEIFDYGGQEPLEAILKRSANPVSYSGVFTYTESSTPAKPGTTERVIGARPQGNCSLSGKLVSESTGKPIAGASMYIFYRVTFTSIFVTTDQEGAFIFKNIPRGPFSLRSSHNTGYQVAVYNPENSPGKFPCFTLQEGEQRSGIMLKANEACRVTGKIRDEQGNVPSNTERLSVYAWSKVGDGEKYSLEQGFVKPNGSYIIDGLSNKPVYVMVTNWQSQRQGEGYPGIYAPDTFFRDEAKLVTFDKSRYVDGVNITRRRTGGLVLEGDVRNEQGEPIPEAFVVVHHQDMHFDRVTAYTDAQGHYAIQGLGDGEVLVHVDAMHRGFVQSRVPITLEKKTPKVRHDFVLHRGATISGKLVDEEGNEWPIGQSNGEAGVVEGSQKPKWGYGWSGLPNKFGVSGVDRDRDGCFYPGDGDYDRSDMLFPTRSTFVFPSMKPGRTLIKFSPQMEGQKVLKILYNSQDVLKSGIDTKPGQEIKDVAIVIGKESAAGSTGTASPDK
jgi:beta-lactamase regulating signal transducer with metallopeptidase domain